MTPFKFRDLLLQLDDFMLEMVSKPIELIFTLSVGIDMYLWASCRNIYFCTKHSVKKSTCANSLLLHCIVTIQLLENKNNNK
jgi:hypothetical protein